MRAIEFMDGPYAGEIMRVSDDIWACGAVTRLRKQPHSYAPRTPTLGAPTVSYEINHLGECWVVPYED